MNTASIPSKQRQRVQLTPSIKEDEALTTTCFGDEILEVEELVAQEMWNAVEKKTDEALSAGPPPFSLVEFVGRQPLEEHAMLYDDKGGSIESFPNKQTLKSMPSYLGITNHDR